MLNKIKTSLITLIFYSIILALLLISLGQDGVYTIINAIMPLTMALSLIALGWVYIYEGIFEKESPKIQNEQ